MTTERPVLFNGTMVRAILSGAKTVTRRPVVPMAGRQRQWLTPALLTQSPRLTMCRLSEVDGGDLGAQMEHPKGGPLGWVRSPLGAPGDRLWVRETWCPGDYWTSGVVHDPPEDIRYAADNSAISYATGEPLRIDTSDWSDPKRWRPSIHMPRWASRLSLDVVSVGVERLHDITEDDARREGIGPLWLQDGEQGCWYTGDPSKGAKMHARTARDAFARLWSEVYGPSAWDANPWVWRVEFTRVEGGR
jgi:hypothetical protein